MRIAQNLIPALHRRPIVHKTSDDAWLIWQYKVAQKRRWRRLFYARTKGTHQLHSKENRITRQMSNHIIVLLDFARAVPLLLLPLVPRSPSAPIRPPADFGSCSMHCHGYRENRVHQSIGQSLASKCDAGAVQIRLPERAAPARVREQRLWCENVRLTLTNRCNYSSFPRRDGPITSVPTTLARCMPRRPAGL